MGKLLYFVGNLFKYLSLIINQIEIISGSCKFREVSQQVRLGLSVIGSPLPLNFLSSITVKLLSQADQVPYQGRELAFWERQKFLIIEIFRSQMLSPWIVRVVLLKCSVVLAFLSPVATGLP
jgi:hypothetical protein